MIITFSFSISILITFSLVELEILLSQIIIFFFSFSGILTLLVLSLLDTELLKNIEEDDENNIKVYIGNENNIDSDMTIIKTKFKKGKEEGTIAIIGPKRMEYDRVVGMLEYMKENIER